VPRSLPPWSIDLVLNLRLIWCDMISASRAWGALVDAKLATEPALSSEAVFFPRLDMHRYSTSYIFRYRALWDKVMGFVILFFAPHRYDEFANAKSKRRTFSKIATHAIVPPEVPWRILRAAAQSPSARALGW
jgi:hypothetical protein